jgi:hypothetical protein
MALYKYIQYEMQSAYGVTNEPHTFYMGFASIDTTDVSPIISILLFNIRGVASGRRMPIRGRGNE